MAPGGPVSGVYPSFSEETEESSETVSELDLGDLLETSEMEEAFDEESLQEATAEEPEIEFDEDFSLPEEEPELEDEEGLAAEDEPEEELGAGDEPDTEEPPDISAIPDDEGIIGEEQPTAPGVPSTASGRPERGGNGLDRGNISKAALFDYLLDLSEALPGERKKAFAESDLPLKIATIRSRLLGSSGLRGQIERSGFATSREQSVPVTPTRIADTFSYLSQISGFLPKSTIGSALQERLARISNKLSSLRERE